MTPYLVYAIEKNSYLILTEYALAYAIVLIISTFHAWNE